MLFIGKVSYVEAQTIQITDNSFNDNYDKNPPQVADGKVVWSGQDGNDSEIFLYEIANGTTTQITNNNYDDREPQINNGKIVWSGAVENYDDFEIFLYDITTGITTQITNNSFSDDIPQIDNGKIVWRGEDGSDAEIYLYDIATATITQLTNNSYADDIPQINGGKIVWSGNDGNDYEIYLHDISSETTTQLTDNAKGDNFVKIQDGKVVWTGFTIINGINRTQIFLYDITTGTITQITNNIYQKSEPMIKDGYVVWNAYDGSDNEVFLYNITSGATTQLTNNSFDENARNAYNSPPQINDGKVVWYGFDGTDYEVYFYDTITNITGQVTNNNYEDTIPQVNQGKVVWYGYNDTDSEVFLWSAPALTSNTPEGNNISYNENDVQLTFSQVTTAGNTSVITSSSGNQPPTGFRLGTPPNYLTISTSAVFSGDVKVCINYSSLTIQGNENNLKLMHFDSVLGWANITTSLDTTNNILCGITTSFSGFAVMAAPTIQDLMGKVEEMNLQQGIENSLITKLQTIQNALTINNSSTSINKLNAFINEVEALKGNKITNSQAYELHAFAANLIKLIQGETQF